MVGSELANGVQAGRLTCLATQGSSNSWEELTVLCGHLETEFLSHAPPGPRSVPPLWSPGQCLSVGSGPRLPVEHSSSPWGLTRGPFPGTFLFHWPQGPQQGRTGGRGVLVWECERLCKQLVTHHIVMSLTCSCWKRCQSLLPPMEKFLMELPGSCRSLTGWPEPSLLQCLCNPAQGRRWWHALGPPASRGQVTLEGSSSLHDHPELLLVHFRPGPVRGQDAPSGACSLPQEEPHAYLWPPCLAPSVLLSVVRFCGSRWSHHGVCSPEHGSCVHQQLSHLEGGRAQVCGEMGQWRSPTISPCLSSVPLFGGFF